MVPLELKGAHKGADSMTPYTYDAVAGQDFLAARVGVAPIPLLLVALKHWREIRKRIDDDAPPMVVAQDLLTRG
jgi:hypothetical protein